MYRKQKAILATELNSYIEYFDIQGNELGRSDKNEHSWKEILAEKWKLNKREK
jgi:hypothetical protein